MAPTNGAPLPTTTLPPTGKVGSIDPDGTRRTCGGRFRKAPRKTGELAGRAALAPQPFMSKAAASHAA
jgi:hypothetical protein